MLVGVITFPGTLDDKDAHRALNIAGIKAETVWHTENDLSRFDALVIAGGRSFGDYLRPGALAQTTPVITPIKAFAETGRPILGIGGGFHVLLEAGLLPGALRANHTGVFLREDATVKVVNSRTPWSKDFSEGEEIVLPIRTQHGAYYADEDDLRVLTDRGQVVLSFTNNSAAFGETSIAGLSNEAGNVVGLLPSPEFAVEEGFGPDTPERMKSGVSGLKFFTSLLS